MDLRQLQYFCRIAESGSFREAANRANVAQSALSRHMRTLEDELGVILLERHARGIRLTSQGEKLKLRADNILREVEETRLEMMTSEGGIQGSVTLGASATTGRLLYARLAETASNRYPQIELNMTEGASYYLLEGLDTGRIDLAVMVDPEPRSYLSNEALVAEKVFLVGAPRHANMPTAPCALQDLAGRPLVLFSRPSGSRTLLETAATEQGISLNVRFDATSPDVIKDFVRRGLGYGVMPYSSIFRDVAAGELVSTEIEGIALTRTFVRRIDRSSSPAVTAIADMIREEFSDLEREGMFGAVSVP
jgi:LysR family transcriptional regulator, nitrogen assimilation regulatory protein